MSITPTPNMGLTRWTAGTDFFNWSLFDDDWLAIDDHDHTLGKGRQIPAGGLAANAVGTNNIQDSAVTTGKLANGAVTAVKIAPGVLGAGVFVAVKDGTDSDKTVNSDLAAAAPSVVPFHDLEGTAGTYNPDGWFDTTTGRYTPQIAGLYTFWCRFSISPSVPGVNPGGLVEAAFFKNGVFTRTGTAGRTAPAPTSQEVPDVGGTHYFFANGSTDYFEVGFGHECSNGAVGISCVANGGSRWGGVLIRAT